LLAAPTAAGLPPACAIALKSLCYFDNSGINSEFLQIRASAVRGRASIFNGLG
jgi:hypothetical protein